MKNFKTVGGDEEASPYLPYLFVSVSRLIAVETGVAESRPVREAEAKRVSQEYDSPAEESEEAKNTQQNQIKKKHTSVVPVTCWGA